MVTTTTAKRSPSEPGKRPTPTLRPYQLEAVTAIEDAALAERHRVLVSLPTGTGKTLVFVEVIRRRGGRALVLAHRDELLGQAEARLVASGIDPQSIGRVQAGRDEVAAPVVLGSVQTLARATRRDRLMIGQAEAGRFATVVIDEAHHAVAPSYGAILDGLGSTVDAGPLVLGVTATPNRIGLDKVLGPAVFSRDLIDSIAEGWLCDLRGRRVGIDFDAAAVRRTHGEYVEADLARVLTKADAPTVITDAWLAHGEDRPTLVFVPGVRLAHATAKALRRHKVSAEAIDGSTTPTDRAAVLERFREGTTRVVVNCALLTEGVDLPHVACVVVARPTLSPSLYSQMIGRGTRLAPGKSDCLVLDLVGASDLHDLGALGRSAPVGLSTLAGVGLGDGASLLDAALGDRDRRERLEALLGEHGRLVADDVALFGRRAMRWLTLPGPSPAYVLGIGDAGHLVVTSDADDRWTVSRLGSGREQGRGVETLGQGLTLDRATALAEDEARGHSAMHLVDIAARWRSKPPTDKQVAYLARVRKLPTDVLASLTRGQANDLIGGTIAADQVSRARRAGALA